MNFNVSFKPWFRWLLIAVLFFGAYKGYHLFTKHRKHSKNFSLEKIRSRNEPDRQVHATSEQIAEMNKILEQPFFFLGRGRQCYAFESSDNKYVLKFFQQERFQVSNYLSVFPDFFIVEKLRMQKIEGKHRKLKKMMKSFQLAIEVAPRETGVLFVHLCNTHNLYKSVLLLDKKGTIVQIPLDGVQFILQRKAKLVKPTIVCLMYENREEEAKKRIEQIFDLLVSCAQKGIQDTDGALIRNNNLGFLEDCAIYIDTGKLVQTDKLRTRNGFEYDLRRLRPLYKWLIKNYPSLAEHFTECRAKAVEQFA